MPCHVMPCNAKHLRQQPTGVGRAISCHAMPCGAHATATDGSRPCHAMWCTCDSNRRESAMRSIRSMHPAQCSAHALDIPALHTAGNFPRCLYLMRTRDRWLPPIAQYTSQNPPCRSRAGPPAHAQASHAKTYIFHIAVSARCRPAAILSNLPPSHLPPRTPPGHSCPPRTPHAVPPKTLVPAASPSTPPLTVLLSGRCRAST